MNRVDIELAQFPMTGRSMFMGRPQFASPFMMNRMGNPFIGRSMMGPGMGPMMGSMMNPSMMNRGQMPTFSPMMRQMRMF